MTQKVEGVLSNIIFRNEDNHFLIGRFETQQEWFKAKGTMITPQLDLSYTLWGEWKENHQYGPTFEFATYEVSYPVTRRELERYIVRTAKWVGPVVAKDLLDTYGTDVLKVLKTMPNEVAATIRGITLERALEVQRMILENEDQEKTLLQLESLLGGLGRKSLPIMAFQKFGKEAPDLIKKNPYILIEIRGIGFPTADLIAMERVKIEPDSPFRKAACINHVVDQFHHKGNTWIPTDVLKNGVNELISRTAEDQLQEMIENEVLVREQDDITTVDLFKDEEYISKKLFMLQKGENNAD